MENRIKIKIAAWVIGVLLFAAAVAAIVYTRPLFSMTPRENGPVIHTDFISVQNGRGNIYFIPCEGGYIAVDAGTNAKQAEETMLEYGITPADVSYVLLTHSDSDHTAALDLFANAQVFMGADEQQMVNGTTKRNFFSRNSLTNPARPVLITESTFDLGGRKVQAIAAPGHTPGSMAFLVDDGYLFVGDAMKVERRTPGVHPYTMDEEQAQRTIDMLLEIDCEAIFTAHYGLYGRAELDE